MNPDISLVTQLVPESTIRKNQDAFNTNNHNYEDLPPGLQHLEGSSVDPIEYYRRLCKTRYGTWKSILHQMQREAHLPSSLASTYHEIPLRPSVCAILNRAVSVGMITLRIPEGEREDVEDAILPLLAPYFPGTYFIRMNECSPKDGLGKMGPFTDAASVLKSLCTSMRIFRALRNITNTNDGEVLHLMPWRPEVSTANEFRVFVPSSGRIRAISQYAERYCGWNDEEKLRSVVPHLLRCNERFVELAGATIPEEGYVLDVHALKNDQGDWVVEPIELNPFGAQLSSGSGLFNWKVDWERMYGLGEILEMKVVSPALEEKSADENEDD